MASATHRVNVNTSLNVRNANGKIIDRLYRADTVEVVSVHGTRSHIRYCLRGGQRREGYVANRYLSPLPASERSDGALDAHSLIEKTKHLKFKWWWVLIPLGIYVIIRRKQGYSVAWAILSLPDWIFYWLNQLQFYIQKPWRFMLHRPSAMVIDLHKKYMWVIPQILLYIVATPLRVVNAAYFNIVDRTVHSLFDSLGEVLLPTQLGMKHAKGFDYLWKWLLGLPLRAGFYLLRLFAVIVEGIACTIFDTFVPTLTMYHGTTPEAAQKITEDNNWQVGNGAYAGYGIYFGAQMRTARHYSRGVIVISRVSLGWIENLNLHPYIRSLTETEGRRGHRITQWAIDNHHTTVEWWREGRDWWEYCLVDHSKGYDNPWRIRPLYVIKGYTDKHHRIEGCVKLWFIPWLLSD